MSRQNRSRGFSLIELMVAMVLGLVIVGGVISVLIANKKSYSTNEGMSQIAESVRTAYELMARDIRQTGGTGCDNGKKIGSNFATGTQWWKTWYPIKGFESSQTDDAVPISTNTGERVSGTDSFHMHSIEGGGYPVETHTPASGTILIRDAGASSFANATPEELLICDFDHATMFASTTYTGGTTTINYSATGNCSSGLGYPVVCGGAGTVYTFPRNAWVGRLQAVDWYVGNNGRTTGIPTSLYRRRLSTNGTILTEEVAAGITDMQITYGITGSDTIVDATSLATAADWAKVNSVFIALTVQSNDVNISSDMSANSGRITRTFRYVIALRNRLS